MQLEQCRPSRGSGRGLLCRLNSRGLRHRAISYRRWTAPNQEDQNDEQQIKSDPPIVSEYLRRDCWRGDVGCDKRHEAQDKKTETTARAASKDSVNDAIHVALIGTGGRCRHLGTTLGTIPGVRITAVCDVYDPHLAEGKKLAEANSFATKKYQEVLDKKDIDAVVIVTPDHWHVPMTVAACEAGKDVYVEKPLTHDLSEGRAVIDAQNKHRRIVQVGMQQRSMPHIVKGAELIKAGRLGEIHKIKLSWNRNTDRVRRGRDEVDPKQVDWKAFLGNAPDQPFDGYRMRNWRWFWDFGGGIFTDLMVHWIDVAHWLADLGQSKERGQHRRALHRQRRVGNARHRADALDLSGRNPGAF